MQAGLWAATPFFPLKTWRHFSLGFKQGFVVHRFASQEGSWCIPMSVPPPHSRHHCGVLYDGLRLLTVGHGLSRRRSWNPAVGVVSKAAANNGRHGRRVLSSAVHDVTGKMFGRLCGFLFKNHVESSCSTSLWCWDVGFSRCVLVVKLLHTAVRLTAFLTNASNWAAVGAPSAWWLWGPITPFCSPFRYHVLCLDPKTASWWAGSAGDAHLS